VSVCTTPAAPSPLPIPYPVVASSIEGIADEPLRTKINGAKIATVGSVLKTCHGNEPGTMKEVVSLNTSGPCFVVMGAPIVFIELGMAGITGSPCMQNKAPGGGASGSTSNAGGTGGAGGGSGGSGSAGGDGHGPGGPAGGGGSGGGGSNSGASGPGGGGGRGDGNSGGAPGSSSGPAQQHQCQGGHPVDLATGYVVDEAADLALGGTIPLVWKRYYSSARRGDTTATLGPGWAHAFEQRIVEDERSLTLRDGQGRSIYFAKIAPGESTFHRREKLTLRRDAEGFQVHSPETRLTQVFAPARAGGPALLRAIRDPWDSAIELFYEGERLARLVDTAGRELRVLWKEGRITRLELRADDRLELWVDYAYSAAGCLVAVTDALGQADAFEYDRFHRMTAATLKTGVRFEYAYEENSGRCRKTWGPKGLYALELIADREARTTRVEGEEPRVLTWNDEGRVTREALPDGTVLIERAFDQDGLLVAQVNGAGEGEQYWYDARGDRIRVVDELGNASAWEYDDAGRPARHVSADGQVTTYTHDERGSLTTIAYPTGRSYALSYDQRGRLTALHDGGGLIRAFEYDGRHNLVAETDARGARTIYGHDALGRPVTRTDALGRTTRASYDRLGRRTALRLPDGTTLQRAYDARGRVLREVDELGQVTRYERGGMGVVTRLIRPDGGAWAFAYTSEERLREVTNPRGESHAFTYDEAGWIVEEKTFDGRVIRYERDAGGRVARVDHPDGSSRVFHYDRGGHLLGEETSDGAQITFRRDKLGRVVEASVESREGGGQRVVTTLERDALGRVVTERQGDRTLRFAYDPRGLRTERTMPDGAVTRYGYDGEESLVSIVHDGHQLVFERDALGRELSRRDGEGRLSIRSAYDTMDRLIEQRALGPTGADGVPAVLVQRQWQYDRAGRVTRIDDGRWGTTQYRYDGAGQLLAATRGAQHEAFAYDQAGALVAALERFDARGAPARWDLAPGNLVKRTPRARFAHDARGRRIAKVELGAGEGGVERVTRYAWDAKDQLREVSLPSGDRVRFTYDAFGRRVRKEITPAEGAPRTVDFVWDGEYLAAEIDSARGPRAFVLAPGTPIPLLQQERKEVFTYVNDQLGAPKELLDRTGAVVWSAAHRAFGAVAETQRDEASERARGRRIDTPFRLMGQYADEETGLCCTRFRYFDPEIGRWCSPDPLGFSGGRDPFGFDGSPTTHADPFGLSTEGQGEGDKHEPAVENVDPKDLRWTQRTAGGRGRADELRESMAKDGYKGDPIDVVRTPDGLTTVDHTRAAVALEQNIPSIPVRVHAADEPLPASMTQPGQERFGTATTWGEAAAHRAGNQDPPLPPTGTTTPPKLPKPKKK
jgi:RHS repeat-associated protein